MLQAIITELTLEREEQCRRWSQKHDDGHTLDEWIDIVNYYLLQAKLRPHSGGRRRSLVKAAAVLVAALESYDRT